MLSRKNVRSSIKLWAQSWKTAPGPCSDKTEAPLRKTRMHYILNEAFGNYYHRINKLTHIQKTSLALIGEIFLCYYLWRNQLWLLRKLKRKKQSWKPLAAEIQFFLTNSLTNMTSFIYFPPYKEALQETHNIWLFSLQSKAMNVIGKGCSQERQT